MTDAADQQFTGILLCTRSGTVCSSPAKQEDMHSSSSAKEPQLCVSSQGILKIADSGLLWKSAGSSRTVEIPQQDIAGFVWSPTARGGQLGIKRKEAHMILFQGFRDVGVDPIKNFAGKYGSNFETQEMAVSGKNWGNVKIDASTLLFQSGQNTAFRIPLRDVGQVQQARDELSLDFTIDDTTGSEREDALVGISFYVPKDASDYPAQDEETPSLAVFHDEVVQHTDTEAAVGDPVATFEKAAVLAPRGRFDVELYLSFLKLTGQAQDYRIQYDNILRLFVLPKSHTPHTLVIISLDPPIRKGQTFYPHIVVQLPTEETVAMTLEITDEQFEEKNNKCGGKLSKIIEGAEPDVFARSLRGLANTKLTKAGNFRTADGTALALRCSYKAEEGFLYPLERAFFFVHKPPTLVVYDEIDCVTFLRQGGGLVAASVKTFDLSVRQRNDQEFLFRGLQKEEWTNLFSFIQAKKIRIDNLEEAEQGPGGNAQLNFSSFDLGEDIDTGLAQQRAKGEVEDEEEDKSFEEQESEDEVEAADEEEEEEEKPKKKRPAPTDKSKSDKQAKKAKATKAEKPSKKEKKKKDPDAPKRGLSAFMLFSIDYRQKVKEEHPNIGFGEVGKVLGQKWKDIDAKEKSKYDGLAKKDKERYEKEKAVYEKKGSKDE